jgi:hypothetical protein
MLCLERLRVWALLAAALSACQPAATERGDEPNPATERPLSAIQQTLPPSDAGGLGDDGAPCNDDDQCANDHCSDGVCCDEACGNSDVTDCQSCLAAQTGLTDGTCATVLAATHVCRPAAGECDLADSCDGLGTVCPADGFKSASIVCRAAVSDCDFEETCSGGAANCPPDLVRTVNASCGTTVAEECSDPDRCDGAGVCLTNHEADGLVCSIGVCSTGVCVPVVQDGGSDAGPTDAGNDPAPAAMDAASADAAADASAAGGSSGGTGGNTAQPEMDAAAEGGHATQSPDASVAVAAAAAPKEGCTCSLPGRSTTGSNSTGLALLMIAAVWTRRSLRSRT